MVTDYKTQWLHMCQLMCTLTSISMGGGVRLKSIIRVRGRASHMSGLCEMDDLAMLQPCRKGDWFLKGWLEGVCMLREGKWIWGFHCQIGGNLEAQKCLQLFKPAWRKDTRTLGQNQ